MVARSTSAPPAGADGDDGPPAAELGRQLALACASPRARSAARSPEDEAERRRRIDVCDKIGSYHQRDGDAANRQATRISDLRACPD